MVVPNDVWLDMCTTLPIGKASGAGVKRHRCVDAAHGHAGVGDTGSRILGLVAGAGGHAASRTVRVVLQVELVVERGSAVCRAVWVGLMGTF